MAYADGGAEAMRVTRQRIVVSGLQGWRLGYEDVAGAVL